MDRSPNETSELRIGPQCCRFRDLGHVILTLFLLGSISFAEQISSTEKEKNLLPWQVAGLKRVLADPANEIRRHGETYAESEYLPLPSQEDRRAILKTLISVVRERVKAENVCPESPPEALKRYGLTVDEWQKICQPKPKPPAESAAEINEIEENARKLKGALEWLADARSINNENALEAIKILENAEKPTPEMIAAIERHASGKNQERCFLILIRWGFEAGAESAILAASRIARDKSQLPCSPALVASFVIRSRALPSVATFIKEASPDLAKSLVRAYLADDKPIADSFTPELRAKWLAIRAQASTERERYEANGTLAVLGVQPEANTQPVVTRVCGLAGIKTNEASDEINYLCRCIGRLSGITGAQFTALRTALENTRPAEWHFLVATRAGTPLAADAVRTLSLQWEMKGLLGYGGPNTSPLLQLADAGAPGAREEMLRAAEECKEVSDRVAATEWLADNGGNGEDVKVILLRLLEDEAVELRLLAARGLALRWLDRTDYPVADWRTRVQQSLDRIDATPGPWREDVSVLERFLAYLAPWNSGALPRLFKESIGEAELYTDEGIDQAVLGAFIRPDAGQIAETLDLIIMARSPGTTNFLALLTYLFANQHEAMVQVRVAKEALGLVVDERDSPDGGDVTVLVRALQVSHAPAFRTAIAGTLVQLCASESGTRMKLETLKGLAATLGAEAEKDNRLQSYAETVQRRYDGLNWWRSLWEKSRSWIVGLAGAVALHILFWIAMLIGYPRWQWVRATMFWNKTARQWLGAGYVGFLLQWVPPLRQLLFEPFRASLLGDARLTQFNPDRYFDESMVVPVTQENDREREGPSRRLREAIPRIENQCLLEGESGLGKTMFVRDLLRRHERNRRETFVFLPAQRCIGDDGVRRAIQNLLQGIAKDSAFLDALIYAGALTVVIDGLNEVPADSREKISAFLRLNPRAKVLVTSQRMEWTPPPAMAGTHWRLQPLSEGQIVVFLQRLTPPGAPLDYPEQCHRYVKQTLDPLLATPARMWAMSVLSNPLDLSVAAQLLAAGKTPNPATLLGDAYAEMARQYYAEHRKEFPMEALAAEAYAMRRDSRDRINRDKFAEELGTLKQHRVVVEVMEMGLNKEAPPCRFRHDKLWAFFTVEHFCVERHLCAEHLGDIMFLQVYEQLVFRLPLNEARSLVQSLGAHAARTGDHTLVDSCLLLLELRCAWDASECVTTHDPLIRRAAG